MRIVVQVVSEASVSVEQNVVAAIGHGELLLVGFKVGDDEAIIDKMIAKLLKLRIFSDGHKTNYSLAETEGNILAVSQFTLYADVRDGNRPSFTTCMPADSARRLFDYFKTRLSASFEKVQYGVFQADMQVELINEGPFTLILDSAELGYE